MPRKKSGNFDQNKYIQEYTKQTYRRYIFQVRKEDTEIINYIDSLPNKQKHIIELIKEDMKKNQK